MTTTPPKRDWRRTPADQPGGGVGFRPDDWTLYDEGGAPIARIHYRGARDAEGWWDWTAFVNRRGERQGMMGRQSSGREARETVERHLPAGTIDLEAAAQRERERRDRIRLQRTWKRIDPKA